MWTITDRQILVLRTPGGDVFVDFVDSLIRGQASRSGLPASEINTNLATTIKDGGVDTEVRQAIPGDPTGWFGTRTCWQYKAAEARTISLSELREEVRKPYSSELIRRD